jgi:hypothetical protein
MMRGDPGFLSFLGGLGKSLIGAIPGVGPIASTAIDAISHAAAPSAAGMAHVATSAAKPGFFKGAATKIGSGVLKHPVLTGAGAAGIAAAAGGLAGAKIEKHMLRGGKRRRRMRATNTKALRRALRRAYAFERIAMKTIKLVHPRKHGRFGGFKKPRKRVC